MTHWRFAPIFRHAPDVSFASERRSHTEMHKRNKVEEASSDECAEAGLRRQAVMRLNDWETQDYLGRAARRRLCEAKAPKRQVKSQPGLADDVAVHTGPIHTQERMKV
jgi:hypothetical protein